MENNRENFTKLAERIYDLDTEVYRCVGSSLGRTLIQDRDTCVSNLTDLMYTRPQGHELRSQLALIANMARTIRNKEDRRRLMREYDQILHEVSAIPSSFGSVDILDQNLAGLNTSNLRQTFSADDHLIICIGRTHGSAGTDIGFALADALKINYYDVEIFQELLKRMDAEKDYAAGQSEQSVQEMLERADAKHGKLDKSTELAVQKMLERSRNNTSSSTLIAQSLKDFDRYHGLPKRDAFFFNQSDLLCDLAKREDFIVMGRCADVILANNRIPHISIFITAPFEHRVRRMMELDHLDYKHAVRKLKRLDRKHQQYYTFYAGRKWGDAVNYDLCINSACYGIEESVELIERMINRLPDAK